MPAIVLADPQLILSIGTGVLSITEAKAIGAEFRANIELPDEGQLKLANTLAHLYRLHETHANLFDEFVRRV